MPFLLIYFLGSRYIWLVAHNDTIQSFVLVDTTLNTMNICVFVYIERTRWKQSVTNRYERGVLERNLLYNP